MAVRYKDYYEILGVPRSATQEQIQKAFRKLARQFHPDVAKNKAEAEEKFKEINEANEVLADPEKRRKYDSLGADWKQGADFRPPPQWGAPPGAGAWNEAGQENYEFEYGGTGFSDFFEQLFGSMRGDGQGLHFESDADEMRSHRGRDVEGEVFVTLEEAAHGSVRSISVRHQDPCEPCHGSGRIGPRKTCPSCGGQGYVTSTQQHQVKIPAGVREGQKLRLAGRGEAGQGRGGAGDILLRVRFARHPEFRTEGDDLFYDVDLAPWEAVLGSDVSIPTLEKPVNIKMPAGSQNGQRLRVRGRGLPIRGGGAGDLYVVIRIVVPQKISDRERALWQQISQESTFKPRE